MKTLQVLVSSMTFTQQTHQRWISVKKRWSPTFINVVSTLIFVWKWKLSRRKFINVASTLAKQRWNNVCRTMSIQCWWTKVVSMLEFGWKRSLTYVYRRCFNVDKTTFKQRWKNYVNSILMTQCCFNIDIWLERKVESTYIHRRWENSIEITLLIFAVLKLTRKWLNNKIKLSFQEKIIYFFYIRA